MAYPYYGTQYGNQYGYQFGYNQPAQDQLSQLRYSQQNQNPDERIWVQGRGSAEAYLVAPNGFVRLWDSLENVYYEKRADSTGRPYMETYEYKKKVPEMVSQPSQEQKPTVDYDKEIKSLTDRIIVLENILKGVKNEQPNADDSSVQSV